MHLLLKYAYRFEGGIRGADNPVHHLFDVAAPFAVVAALLVSVGLLIMFASRALELVY